MDSNYHKTPTPTQTNVSMSSGPSTGTAIATTTTRTLKLKDSCDTCAASKIRCDKRKPLCGRCTRLGYPCFYSPARRTGHTFARRRASASASATAGASTDTDTASPVPVAGSIPSGSRERERKERMEMLAAAAAARRRHLNLHSALATPPTSASSASSRSTTTTTTTPTPASLGGSQNDASASGRTTSPNSDDAAELACASDCASVAWDMLLQLERAKVKLQLSAPGGANNRHGIGSHASVDVQRVAAHAAIGTVTAAFRTLSAVLVCPCSSSAESSRHDVGLLAAAVLLSMLDVYHAIIVGHSTPRSTDLQPPPVRSAPISDTCMLTMSTEDDFLFWADYAAPTNPNTSNSINSESISLATYPTPRDDVTIVRVLGELTKVAQVVLQFAKRYWDGDGDGDGDEDEDAEKHSPDFLKALANLLRLRLQSVTAEATVL